MEHAQLLEMAKYVCANSEQPRTIVKDHIFLDGLKIQFDTNIQLGSVCITKIEKLMPGLQRNERYAHNDLL